MDQIFSATNLRVLRIERGYSRMQLAFAIRRHVDQVGAWERGRDVPNNASLTRLLHALDCRVEDLFEDSVVPVGGGGDAGSSQLLVGAAPASRSSRRRAQ